MAYSGTTMTSEAPVFSGPDFDKTTTTSTVPNSTASAPYQAPTLYGPNGQTASPTSSTTKAQVDAAIASGWSTQSPQNSDPNKPSSSATVPLNVAANSNAENASSTNLPGTPGAAANSLSSFAASFGINVSPADIQGLMDSNPGMTASDAFSLIQQGQSIKDAKEQGLQQTQQQQNIYNAELAQQNAQYASQSSVLAQDRANAKDSATAQLASLNASGGIGSDSGQFLSHIDAQFDLAGQQLTLMAQQAKAALDSGNAQAYASIQANMANTISTVRANISNLLGGIKASNTANAQFEQQEQDKNATLYRDTLTQLPLAQADQLSSLPSDWGQLNSKQMDTVRNSTAYQQGKSAGLSDQAILGDLRGLSTSGSFAQQRITNQANQATARLAIAQANLADKQAAAIDSTVVANNGGGDFLTAFQQVNSQHSKQENNDFMSSMASLLQAGNKTAAANSLTNYVLNPRGNSSFSDAVDALRVTAGIVQPIMNYIKSLPADQQSGFLKGNYQTVAAKLGQNPNPQLQKLGSELSHVGVIYGRAIAGVRGASSAGSGTSIFSQLIPGIKDSSSLQMSDLGGFVNTANDLLNSAISTKIGQDTFQNIYGDGGALGGKFSPSQSPQVKTYTLGGVNINVGQQFRTSDGKVYTMGADGKPVPAQ